MATPLLAALDIGSSRTTLLVGEPDEGGAMRVLGRGCAETMGVRKGLVVNLEHASQSVAQAVGKVVDEKRFDIGRVILSASGGYVTCMTSQGSLPVRSRDRLVTAEDVEDVYNIAREVVLPSPTAMTLHSIRQKFRLDGQSGIANPEGLKGSTLALGMLVVYSEKGPVDNLQSAASASSIDIEDTVFGALAASHAVLSQEQMDAGAALIDLGAGCTGHVVYVDGCPVDAASLSVGGDHATNDISRAFVMSNKRAERLKLEYGSALPGGGSERIAVSGDFGFGDRTISRKALRTVINARYDELFKIVRTRFDRLDLTRKLGAGIVFTGGGAAMPGVCELAQSIFGVPCTVGALRNIRGLEDVARPESFAVPAGLLVYGYKSYLAKHHRRGGFFGSILRMVNQ